ncbi:hypothetical protein BDR04DRAFT_1122454, partial [Suillus decipiens]
MIFLSFPPPALLWSRSPDATWSNSDFSQDGKPAALHGRRSRRGRHSGLDLGPPDPLYERLLATFAEALGCMTSLRPVRLLSIPWSVALARTRIGHPGPCQLKTLVVSQGRARDER